MLNIHKSLFEPDEEYTFGNVRNLSVRCTFEFYTLLGHPVQKFAERVGARRRRRCKSEEVEKGRDLR